jgi:hypothetical protein
MPSGSPPEEWTAREMHMTLPNRAALSFYRGPDAINGIP